jgi:hypothetical protein
MGYSSYDYASAAYTNVSGTGAVSIIPASGNATTKRNLCALVITTANAAAATLTLNDGSGTVAVLNFPDAAVAPGAPFVLVLHIPLRQTAPNTAWTLTASVNASGFNVTAEFVEED